MTSSIQRSLLVVLCGGLLLGSASCTDGQALQPEGEVRHESSTRQTSSVDFEHNQFSKILKTIVNDQGLVDYMALQRNPSQLNSYLKSLAAVPKKEFKSWSNSEQIAFLINAYNAYTLSSIIENKPIRASIRDIPGVWRVKKHALLGGSLTLDHIEHQILRKKFNEPRIHAALVCAAISCPPLRNEAFTGSRLNQQLEDQTTRWLASQEGLQIKTESGNVLISSIFQWFREDWQRADPNFSPVKGQGKNSAVLRFIARYRPKEQQDYLLKGEYKLSYLPYNWKLNQQRQ